jgi:hypothetical protein
MLYLIENHDERPTKGFRPAVMPLFYFSICCTPSLHLLRKTPILYSKKLYTSACRAEYTFTGVKYLQLSAEYFLHTVATFRNVSLSLNPSPFVPQGPSGLTGREVTAYGPQHDKRGRNDLLPSISFLI